MSRGFFVTFEGLDRTGKSTQVSILGDALRARGFDVLVTREPGGTALGRLLRDIMLRRQEFDVAPRAELLLMAADRAQHVSEVIGPALAAGKVVISDRFADSSLAYQGYGFGLDLEAVEAINRIATGGLQPDLTIYLSGEVTVDRQADTSDRIEGRSASYRHRVGRGYEKIALLNPSRVHRIEVTGRSAASVHSEILDLVLQRMHRRGLTRAEG